jgi:anthranilate synthase component 2
MKKILVLDNYDSFTYNLVHLVRELTTDAIEVHRNNKITVEEVAAYDKIILSPGPGIPEEAGIMPELLKTYSRNKRILGVCLGHQAIGEAFGAKLINLPRVMHGKESKTAILSADELLFRGISSPIITGRYHSWAVDRATLPKDLKVTAETDDGIIMALSHRELDVRGVQFHPESVLTPQGREMLNNWLTA